MRSPPEPSNETTMNCGGRSGGGFGGFGGFLFGAAWVVEATGEACPGPSLGTAARTSPAAAQAASAIERSHRIAASLHGAPSGSVQPRFRMSIAVPVARRSSDNQREEEP
jgi:hypothetical protein